jgi:hypothetical protein
MRSPRSLSPVSAAADTVNGMQEEQKVRRDQFTRLTRVAIPEVVPPPPRRWADQEWVTIGQGHRARDMDDKWQAFVENDRLFLHRSWTGFGIYEAQFTRSNDSWSITELLVSGDRSTYRRASDAYEAVFVEAIIDGVLLGKWDTDAWTRLRSMPRE